MLTTTSATTTHIAVVVIDATMGCNPQSRMPRPVRKRIRDNWRRVNRVAMMESIFHLVIFLARYQLRRAVSFALPRVTVL